MTIKAEPVIVNLDPVLLGKGPAVEMTKIIKKKIRAISAPAAPSTIARRERVVKSLDLGKRYSGGRLGAMLPNQGGKLFNDSGRLATGIVARPNRKEESWTVNVPANRFDPTTFNGGLPAIILMVERLASYVPEFKNPELLVNDPDFRRALKESAKRIHEKKLPLGTPAERVSAEIARSSSSALSEMQRFAALFGLD